MSKSNIILKLAPAIFSMLKMNGINIDIEFIKAMQFFPNYIKQKQKEYEEKAPDEDINLMISFHEEDIYLMPVGLVKNEEEETVINTKFEPFNLTEFLQGIQISELVKILKDNPDITVMEAVEKSRV